MPSKLSLNLSIAAILGMLSMAGAVQAADECKWESTPGPMQFNHNLGAAAWVARDAPIGSKIASWGLQIMTGTDGARLVCDSDGLRTLTANVTTPLALARGPFPPVDGRNVDGKVLQTSIPGVGLYVEFSSFLNGTANNHFKALDGVGALPFVAEQNERMAPNNLTSNIQRLGYIALIKTDKIPAGPQLFSQEVARANISDVGDALRLTLSGQVMQAQCTLKADAVSANPVQLGQHDIAEFTGQGSTTNPVDFFITLSDCEDDPAGSVARAFMRLDAADGSAPIDRDLGLFSLTTTESSASGIGIQVLRSDNTPVKLEEFIDMAAVTPGTMRFDLRARYYQTAPAVTPGEAKGALNFTIEYR
ncbi:MAG: fimbrial protein [Candidatus Pseudomonas phytovorans]|uniref:Fimbrial protein n=1 Tax=Candidatus Pseudomonas phytovorans TaxID=3121377 RepID=A0AAJ6BBG3_9PSED|nr:fimbrial protein [Pseudomonas sp.]WEK29704.1 MAG: fimbrial protein [Pseudomonas sp.]